MVEEYNHHGILILKKEHVMHVTLQHSAKIVNPLKSFQLCPSTILFIDNYPIIKMTIYI